MTTAVNRWRRLALLLLGGMAVLSSACSSGGSSSAPESLPPANTSSGGSCPFSGTTAPTQGPGQATGAAITSLSATVSGCIDNVTAKFSGGTPSWTVGYSDGPFVDAKTGKAVSVPGPADLVVTFAGTSYPGVPGGTTPATLPPSQLHYVKAVSVITGTGGSLEFIVSLPQQMQYTTSVSKTPSDFVLGIG
jgi:hypothetical protein